MGDLPTTTGLTAETRELLAAIRDALDLPYPADPDPADRDERNTLLDIRRALIVGTLDALVNEPASNHAAAAAARMLRKDQDRHPVDYATRETGR